MSVRCLALTEDAAQRTVPSAVIVVLSSSTKLVTSQLLVDISTKNTMEVFNTTAEKMWASLRAQMVGVVLRPDQLAKIVIRSMLTRLATP